MTQALCYSAVSANRTSCLTPQPKRRRVPVACLGLCSEMRQDRLALVCTVHFVMSRLPSDTTAGRLDSAGAPTPATTHSRSFHHLSLTQIISVSFSVMLSSRVISGLPTERFLTDHHATSVNAFLYSSTHLHCPTVKPHGGLRKSRIPTSHSRTSREAPSYHA
jgi:hypothetical protein